MNTIKFQSPEDWQRVDTFNIIYIIPNITTILTEILLIRTGQRKGLSYNAFKASA